MGKKYTIRLGGLNRVLRVNALNDVIKYYDLTIVLSGSMQYIINGVEYTLNSRDGILIPPGHKRVRLRSEHGANYFVVNFFLNEDEKLDFPIYMPECMTPSLRDVLTLFDKIIEERSDAFVEEKKELVLELILLFLRENVEKKVYNPHVNKILYYIQTHFTEPITLQDIANYVHLTVPYCCSLVKEELNMTIYELILRERILLAQEYILQGNMLLKDVPYHCGFNDYSHFSKSFKKYTGLLPSRYKKEMS